MSPRSNMCGIIFAHASEKSTAKYFISFIAKLSMYLLGTVRMSLLHVIMMIGITLPVVPNINRIADTGNS